MDLIRVKTREFYFKLTQFLDRVLKMGLEGFKINFHKRVFLLNILFELYGFLKVFLLIMSERVIVFVAFRAELNDDKILSKTKILKFVIFFLHEN